MIALVDYGSGNIRAIANVFRRLNVPTFVASTADDLTRATKIILPGVGAFDQAMEHLEKSGMRGALTECAVGARMPLLGICVGMQLLARSSEEGTMKGLGWIDAEVRKFDPSHFTQQTRLPHMGWNDVRVRRPHPLFDSLEVGASFYFLHSYYFSCARPDDELADSSYGGPFACAVSAGNILGVQFHPEKSHQAGIQLLKNFAAL